MNGQKRNPLSYGDAPPELVHRYQNDAVFHRVVKILVGMIEGDGVDFIGAADIREASLVAVEIVRHRKIQERMNEPAPATVVPSDMPGRGGSRGTGRRW